MPASISWGHGGQQGPLASPVKPRWFGARYRKSLDRNKAQHGRSPKDKKGETSWLGKAGRVQRREEEEPRGEGGALGKVRQPNLGKHGGTVPWKRYSTAQPPEILKQVVKGNVLVWIPMWSLFILIKTTVRSTTESR